MLLRVFLDETFGLGYVTSSEGTWINGGSPTSGYLKFAVSGTFEQFFTSIAGNDVIDMPFMPGPLLLGVALLLGIGMRLATIGGILVSVQLEHQRASGQRSIDRSTHRLHLLSDRTMPGEGRPGFRFGELVEHHTIGQTIPRPGMRPGNLTEGRYQRMLFAEAWTEINL